MTEDAIAIVLAGGVPTRDQFSVLTMNRSKAALPFGGVYRLIDFSLSCLMNSDIERVGIVTQFLPSSLIDHVGDGFSWDMKGYQRCAKILPPYISYEDKKSWYKGTGNAILQNINFIKDRHPEYVFIVPGEHIYNVDFKDILQQHIASRSKVSLAYKKMPSKKHCPRFGYVQCEGSTITDFIEKPPKPRTPYVSMGIYLFNTDILIKELESQNTDQSFFDLVSDVIVPLSRQKKIHGYEYTGNWAYLYDFYDYYYYHMALINEELSLKEWNIITNLEDRDTGFRPPTEVSPHARINNSLISPGCIIEGEVHHSVLSPGVHVKKNSSISNSILMHDVKIKENTRIHGVICDKDVCIGKNGVLGNQIQKISSKEDLILVGKGSHIQDNQNVDAGTHIKPRIIL